MKLKYVGPKPSISHKGICFDNNKEDKYVYLSVAVSLIKALDHDYIENKSYTYEENHELSSRDLLDAVSKYCPDIDKKLDKTNHSIEDEIEDNIRRAHESASLSKEDKSVLIKNIEIMHDYMLQREVNRTAYYCALGVLANLVKKDHIDHITTPMLQKYIHVLHSLQGVLLEEKYPIDTKMDFFKKDNGLFVTLQVVNILNEK